MQSEREYIRQLEQGHIERDKRYARMQEEMDALRAELATAVKERDEAINRYGLFKLELASLKPQLENAETSMDSYRHDVSALLKGNSDLRDKLTRVTTERDAWRTRYEQAIILPVVVKRLRDSARRLAGEFVHQGFMSTELDKDIRFLDDLAANTPEEPQ
jgi:chromosome segregation ATPase